MSSWEVLKGDCISVLAGLEPDSIDACITDPPYGLKFMGKKWDHGVPGEAYWKEVLRVLKPGGWLIAFGGTRTHHRLMVAIEDAGFEIRDCLMWLYGSGFPKALNISKAIDKAAGAKRKIVGTKRLTGNACVPTKKKGGTYGVGVGTVPPQEIPITAPATPEAKLWDGWATALKPAHEPIILAMKPLDGTFTKNALTHGVAGLNVNGCRIGQDKVTINTWDDGAKPFGGGAGHAYTPKQVQGRWPANVVLDEEAGKMLDEQTGTLTSGKGAIIKESAPNKKGNTSTAFGAECRPEGTKIFSYEDSGGASRFFYCAKASRAERTHKGAIANNHPTVKPLALMRWLCRLVSTPIGGTILDPFAGSGSTGVAALQECLNFVGVELEEKYVAIAEERLSSVCPKEEPKEEAEPEQDQAGDDIYYL